MKRFECQYLVIVQTSRMIGAGVAILTRMTAAATTTMGTTECIATHSVQWSASLSDTWTCTTWRIARSTSRLRHTTVATLKAPGFEWQPAR